MTHHHEDSNVVHRYFSLVPDIRLVGDDVACNEFTIQLTRRLLTLKLFKAFLDRPGCRLSRAELVAAIYGEFHERTHSARFKQALALNLVKLMSRARHIADEAVNRDGKWIEWFCFHPDESKWSLYQVTPYYLEMKDAERPPWPSMHNREVNF